MTSSEGDQRGKLSPFHRPVPGRHNATSKNLLRWAVGLLFTLAPMLATAETLRGMPLLRRYGPED